MIVSRVTLSLLSPSLFFKKKKIWRIWVLFVGPLISLSLFWTSGDISSRFQSQNGQPHSHLAEAYNPCRCKHSFYSVILWHVTQSLRFTSGATHADQYPSRLFHIPARHWWDSKTGAIMLLLTVWDQADALPTELSRLGFTQPLSISNVPKITVNVKCGRVLAISLSTKSKILR